MGGEESVLNRDIEVGEVGDLGDHGGTGMIWYTRRRLETWETVSEVSARRDKPSRTIPFETLLLVCAVVGRLNEGNVQWVVVDLFVFDAQWCGSDCRVTSR